MKLHEDWISSLQNKRKIDSEPFCPMGKSMGESWTIVFPEKTQQIGIIEGILLASIQYLTKITNKK